MKNLVMDDKREEDRVLEGRDESGSRGSLIRRVAVASRHSGPLPPPDQLQHYNDVLPGAAERIFVMAENREKERLRLNAANQVHVHAMDVRSMEREVEVVRREFTQFRVGQIFAFLLGVLALLGAFILAGLNPDSNSAVFLSAILGTSGLGSLVYAFTRQGDKRLAQTPAELAEGRDDQQARDA